MLGGIGEGESEGLGGWNGGGVGPDEGMGVSKAKGISIRGVDGAVLFVLGKVKQSRSERTYGVGCSICLTCCVGAEPIRQRR